MKSTQGDCIAPSRKGKHINESERQQIERWLLEGVPVKQIAALLQRHPSSICREIKRGTVTNIRSDLSEYQAYRAQRAQADYLCNCGAGGSYLKLAWDSEIAKRLHTLMTVNKMSPYAAIEIARQENLNINFCARIFYNYIHHYNYPFKPPVVSACILIIILVWVSNAEYHSAVAPGFVFLPSFRYGRALEKRR